MKTDGYQEGTSMSVPAREEESAGAHARTHTHTAIKEKIANIENTRDNVVVIHLRVSHVDICRDQLVRECFTAVCT